MATKGRVQWRFGSARRARAERGQDMAAGEAPIKQAVKWIEEQLQDHPGVDRVKLVDEASRRFDLSPLDEDFLYRHLAARTRKV